VDRLLNGGGSDGAGPLVLLGPEEVAAQIAVELRECRRRGSGSWLNDIVVILLPPRCLEVTGAARDRSADHHLGAAAARGGQAAAGRPRRLTRGWRAARRGRRLVLRAAGPPVPRSRHRRAGPQLQPATTLRPAGWGRRRLYRTDFSDQHSLTRDLGVPVRTYFGLDSRLATGALAALTWAPGHPARRGGCTCQAATDGWR
jgi:hypothetical protein